MNTIFNRRLFKETPGKANGSWSKFAAYCIHLTKQMGPFHPEDLEDIILQIDQAAILVLPINRSPKILLGTDE